MSRRRVVSLSLSLLTVATACLVGYVLWARNRPSPAPVPLTDEEVIQVWRDAGFEYGWCGKDFTGTYRYQESPAGLVEVLPAFRQLQKSPSVPLPQLPELSKPYAVMFHANLFGPDSTLTAKDFIGRKNFRLRLATSLSPIHRVSTNLLLEHWGEAGLVHVLDGAEGPGGARPTGPEDVVTFTVAGGLSSGIKQLQKLPNLATLRGGDGLSLEGELGNFPKLSSLSVGMLGAHGLKALQALPNFTSLEVGRLSAEDDVLVALKGLEHLTHLRVGQWDGPAAGWASDSALSAVADIPSLTSLGLGPVGGTGAGLRELARLPNLKELSLHLPSGPALQGQLKELAALKGLTALDLTVNQVTDADLKVIGRISRLDRLALRSSQITDAGLEALKGLSRLTSLDLMQSKTTDAGLAWIGGLNNLKGLNLHGTRVTDAGLKTLKGLVNLTSLNLELTGVTDARLSELAGLTKLDTLTLSSVTDRGAQALRKAGLLHDLAGAKGPGGARPRSPRDVVALDVRLGPGGLTAAGLKELADFRGLVWLDLGADTDTEITDGTLRALREIGLLHAYRQAMTPTGGRPGSAREVARLFLWKKVTAAGLRELKDLTNLTYLHLTEIDDAGLRALREIGLLHALNMGLGDMVPMPTKAEDVRSLNLVGKGVTDVGLRELANFKNLKILDLRQTKVTGKGLKELAGLTSLEEVRLDPAVVTDNTLKALSALKGLTRLELYGSQVTNEGLKEVAKLPRLGYLDIGGTKVTDEGLAELKGLKSLTQLHLNGTEVTDAGLRELIGLQGLTYICLNATKVTQGGVLALRRALPDCKVVAGFF